MRPRLLSLLAATALCTTLSACASSEGTVTRGTVPFQAAENLKRTGNYEAAAQGFATIYAKDSSAVDAAIELAAVERKLGQPENAVELLGKVHKDYPESTSVLSQLGYALIDAGKTEDAVKLFDGLIALDPRNPQGYSGKAVAFDKSGNHLAAQDIYLEAMAAAPDSLTIRNNLAMSLILNGEPHEAITVLEPVYEAGKSNPTIRQNLALAYGLTGNEARALELNLRDLPPEQAKENLRFYKKYLRQYNIKRKASGIGFKDTSDTVKKKLSLVKPKPAAPKPQAMEAEITEPQIAGGPPPEARPVKPKPEAPEPAAAAPQATGNNAVLATGNGLGGTQLRTGR